MKNKHNINIVTGPDDDILSRIHGNCRNNSICSKADGSCEQGCKTGYTGNKCNESCRIGYYGDTCAQRCSANCFKNTCNSVNGNCFQGCKPGWVGLQCEQECMNGTYGSSCSLNCSGNCMNDSTCKPVDGYCLSGCNPGWTGNTCHDKCQDGFYGAKCTLSCSRHCLNGTLCINTNGTCTNGCDPGWTGDTCKDVCRGGTYGAECVFMCSSHCLNGSACFHTNGSCTNGCDPGWTGDTCVDERAVFILYLRFNSFQASYRRHQKRDDVIFHNELYINEQVATEGIPNIHDDQAMSAQTTDPVYTNTSLVDIQLNGVKVSNDVEYYNDIPTKRTPNAISISELENAMKKKCLIKGYFLPQFETIATGLLYPTTAAVKRRNIHKNRFKKMYPYDHCRVKLKILPREPDSDYINASFIKGQGKADVYIASQGPVTENINDFWRMIWEMDVRTVVMVTNLAENGKMKCIQYWGTKDVVVPYGKIHVTTQAENVYAEFTIRELMLFHQGDVLTKRNVTQFHFTAWPDKGVPKTSTSLLQFWRKVRQNDENKDHIWLVHCSAGVGRTGTFLATDILFDQGENMGFVDVYQCVINLREQRVNLVQTHEQYIYLHKLMLEVFSLPSKPFSLDEFMTSYQQLQEKDKSGKMKLWREYKSIESGISWPTAVNDQQEGEKKETTVDILADAFRPILSNYVPGSSNAIKATCIPSYFDLHEYIIAQWRPQFKMETCRLVFEKQIETVVTFPIDQRDDEIFFEESVSESDPFAVVCQSQIKKGDFIVKDHFLQSRNGKHYFKEIIFKCWSSESLVPEDPQAILDLMTEVDTQRHHSSAHGRKSILFQCWDGVDRSGLLAVIINVLDRARVDNEVSIPQVIRQLRHNKKELITNFEQYKFCYDVLYCRLASKATYANV
ncbi:receptor-type tyrosine-protein phosphatase alpha-like [Mercenaria mercenaria]|uniref:receptor-type tyrosine-protein phosphatase alpha-like n=1 Tax=Mercenaria mercenaria TaxID=6596 RepID=UPI00234E7513|nr:receptor-type tyrosine-protein phosphatase alpha-like [Mercenaria mercenaria]